MDYKNQRLDRSLIISKVREYCDKIFETSNVANNFELKGTTRNRLSIDGDGNSFYIDFHFNKNETTTIETFGGSCENLKVQIADYLLTSNICEQVSDDQTQHWFVAENIKREDLDSIIDLIRNDYGDELQITQSQGSNCIKWDVVGKYSEKVVVHFYNTTSKTMVQGKPRRLFITIISAITELIGTELVTNVFNTSFNLNIKKDDIITQFQIYLPNSISKLSPKVETMLHQAIYNINIQGEMFDYSFMAFPAYRGLEGHLKHILRDSSITISKNFREIFDPINDTQLHCLKPQLAQTIANQDKVDYIEKVYNTLNLKRNKLFHYGPVDLNPNSLDTTIIHSNFENTKMEIIDTLTIIDDYFRL